MEKVSATVIEIHDAVQRFVRFGLVDQKFVQKDPFIYFDHFNISAPTVFANHPHSGFESVTYVVQGELFHGDNAGNKNVLGPGGIQNMCAGGGIIHREIPIGVANGLNLWVNLPHDKKRIPCDFQVSRKAQIPTLQNEGATVRVLMGNSLGMRSRIQTQQPTVMLDIMLNSGSSHTQPIDRTWTTFIYTMQGTIVVGAVTIKTRHTADISGGDFIKFENKTEDKKPARFFFFSGISLKESMYIHSKGNHAYVMESKDAALEMEKLYNKRVDGFEE
uniref:pirin-like n=1 Tax=Styela clava TaxID=7725 RepID=UPI001939AAD0|nr:pirin-like [Styela clava]